MKTDPTLLPCPCCGSPYVNSLPTVTGPRGWWVGCASCGLGVAYYLTDLRIDGTLDEEELLQREIECRLAWNLRRTTAEFHAVKGARQAQLRAEQRERCAEMRAMRRRRARFYEAEKAREQMAASARKLARDREEYEKLTRNKKR